MRTTVSIDDEIEIKRSIGKLEMEYSCEQLRVELGAEWLPLRAEHAMRLRSLPLMHRDPFDRLLIAQALAESKGMVTSDVAFDQYVPSGLRIVH